MFENIDDLLELSLEELSRAPRHDLWIPAPYEGETPVVCSCVKEGAADVICLSCYGIGILGGYRKYGYNYIELGSTMTTLNYNPAEVQEKQSLRPYRLELVDGVDSANIVSDPVSFTFYASANNEYRLDSYLKDTNNTIVVTYDAGAGSQPLSNIVNESGVKTITFTITMTRDSGERSPYFEFLRVRSQDDNIREPYIRLSRSRNIQDTSKEKGGLVDTPEGVIAMWTILPFELMTNAFVANIEQGNPFYDGRYEIFNFVRSFFDQYRFRQTFSARLTSQGREIYSRVF